MTPGAMLLDMRNISDPRQLAGEVVRDEIAARGLKQDDAANMAHMSPATLARVMKGDPKVKDITLRQIERPLELPHRLLSHIIDGNVDRIRTLAMDENLRADIVASLEEVKGGGSGADAGRTGRRDA